MDQLPELETPAMRRKLVVSEHPVWISIDTNDSGIRLGYRKDRDGGVWLGGLNTGDGRIETVLGRADDEEAPPEALTVMMAKEAACNWADRIRARSAESTESSATAGKAINGHASVPETGITVAQLAAERDAAYAGQRR